MVFIGDDEGRDWVVVIYLRYEDRLKKKMGMTKVNKGILPLSFLS
jgi:hypothetical protein